MPAVAPVTRARSRSSRRCSQVSRKSGRSLRRRARRSGMMVPIDHAPPPSAVANQKGGVAKTTSVASIGAALAELGHSVLLVDLDPQACLTFSLGIDPEDLELSVHHVLTKGLDPTEVIVETDDGVALLPATIELARAEADLLTRTGREHVLRTMLEDLARQGRALRLGPARLPTVAGRAHGGCAHRRRRRADPAAVRDAVAPRRRPAARHRARRPPLHQPRPRGVGRAAHALRRPHDARPHRARDDLRDLRPRRHRAADPEDHQVRRGARGRTLDPRHQPPQQGCGRLPRGGRQPRRPGQRPPPPRRWAREQAPRTRPGRRRAQPTRPRYGRITVLGVSVLTTGDRACSAASACCRRRPTDRARRDGRRDTGPVEPPSTPSTLPGPPSCRPEVPTARWPAGSPRPTGRVPRKPDRSRARSRREDRWTWRCRADSGERPSGRCSARAGSGSGWSRTTTRCERTYLRVGQPRPTTSTPAPIEVYSRSADAIGIDDSGTMQWFVRFTQGPTGAAIGFHYIPIDDGEPVQTESQLGTPAVARVHPAEADRREGHVGLRRRWARPSS